MTFIIQNRGIGAFLLAFSVSACSGAGDFAGGGKSSGSKKAGDEKEEDDADEPAQVAGAFLMNCAYIQSPVFGCTAIDPNTKKPFVKEENEFGVKLFNDASDEVDMNSDAAPEASAYHVIGNLPAAYKDSGFLKMSVKPITGNALAREATKKTKDIDELSLGNSDEDYDFSFGETAPLIDSQQLGLVQFEVHASWLGGIGMVARTAIPSNFCVGGQIQPKLADTAKVFSDGFTNMFKDPNNPSSQGIGSIKDKISPLPGGKAVIGAKTSICFTRFSNSMFEGEQALAHAGSGCIFVWSKTAQGEALLIGTEMQDGKLISLGDLRAFAKAKNESQQGCN